MSKSSSSSDVLQTFNPNKVILPATIGVVVIILLLLKNFDLETFKSIDWSISTLGYIGIAIGLMVARHYALMYRIRTLLENKLTWWQTFEVTTLWEFGSAATPSTVGGTAIALFLLTREKISAGETITVVLYTIFLDGMFFIIGIPLLWTLIGNNVLHPSINTLDLTTILIILPFVLGYLVMILYTLGIAYGLFFNPRAFKWFIIKMTSSKNFILRYLNRFRSKAIQTGDDMITASKELRLKDTSFWISGITSTFFIWTFRFLVLNFVALAIISVSDHILLFGRQLILYIFMILAPTPGGSGVAEGAFGALLYDFFPGESNPDGTISTDGLWVIVVFLWRLVSYYPYLLLGVLIMPAWLKRVLGKSKIEG